MNATKPLRNLAEVARLAGDVFDQTIKPQLRPEDDDKFIAIDVETGDYELDDDDCKAIMQLRTRRPTGGFRLGRVGHAAEYKIRRCR